MNALSIYQWLYEKRFTWLGGLPVLLLRTTAVCGPRSRWR
jgi:hypothetical protein